MSKVPVRMTPGGSFAHGYARKSPARVQRRLAAKAARKEKIVGKEYNVESLYQDPNTGKRELTTYSFSSLERAQKQMMMAAALSGSLDDLFPSRILCEGEVIESVGESDFTETLEKWRGEGLVVVRERCYVSLP